MNIEQSHIPSKIKIVERIALFFVLYIAVLTLSIFLLYMLARIRISGFSPVSVISAVTIILVAFYYLNRLIRQR